MTTVDALQNAIVTIKKLKKLLQEQQLHIYEHIAITGLSCRFPRAENKNAYWQLLATGKNAITTFPEERWQLLKDTDEMQCYHNKNKLFGGYIDAITDFDAYFFGISPREARRMDPQQRILLEVAYESILDAGMELKDIKGSNTGVFVSLYASQIAHLQILDDELDALFLPTGSASSIAANRLSYQFDLHGPSVVFDTSCSSSLVALHYAILSIQKGLCESALVGGVHLNILPSIYIALAQAKMLSPIGQCKTFDSTADGYIPGEGVGVIHLKPLKKALADNDRIYAVIAGSSINQDGKTNGLTAPNGLQQEKLLQSVYQASRIKPQQVSYVECHGTGTFLGDPIEIQALGNVLGKNRSNNQPCWIGSVKTNIGHLEPAAGIASIIKVALALQQQKIPAHLNFATPNPHIAFDKYGFSVPTTMIDWPSYNDKRIAGISSFGFGGTNAHVILTEAENLSENKAVLTHQWQHKHYWPALKNYASHTGISSINPFQAKKISSPLNYLQFEFQFNTHHLPEIKDTYHVLHAGYYLEMLSSAISETFHTKQFCLKQLSFLAAIFVPDQTIVIVQLIMHQQADQSYECYFYSKKNQNKNWQENAKGYIHLAVNLTQSSISIEQLKNQCRHSYPGQMLYDKVNRMGMPTGDSIRWTKQYWLGDNNILCELATPQCIDKTKHYSLNMHPGIIDGSMQPCFMLLPDTLLLTYMAETIHDLIVYDVSLTPSYLAGKLIQLPDDHQSLTIQWQLLSNTGEILLSCQQVILKQLAMSADSNQTLQKINLLSFTLKEQKEIVAEFLGTEIATIFAMPKTDIYLTKTLLELGIDSLLAINLIRSIELTFDVNYPLSALLTGPSLQEMITTIINSVAKNASVPITTDNPWLCYRQPQKHCQLRLFCFPYGGGGASVYRHWQQHLPDTIEVCPVQLPGREGRMHEQGITNISTLIDYLIVNLRNEFSSPFAFYGHSLGALTAFELTRTLRKQQLPQPKHLFVAAFPDPALAITANLTALIADLLAVKIDLFDLQRTPSIDSLTDDQLMQLFVIFNKHGLVEYGDSLLDRTIMKVLLPIFVADMSIIKHYRYIPEMPLDIPIHVLVGKQDLWVPYEDHLTWNQHTTKSCLFHEVDAGHLFIRDPIICSKVLAKLSDDIASHSISA